MASIGSKRASSIAWTRVHAIINQSTCAKSRLSEDDQRLTLWHVASQGASDLHQIKCIKWSVIAIRRPRFIHFEDHQGRTRGCISTWRSSSDGSINNKGEVVHHWGAIEGRDHNAIVAPLLRSHDPIPTRSWPDWCTIHGHNHQELMATIIVRSWAPMGIQSWIKWPKVFWRKSL